MGQRRIFDAAAADVGMQHLDPAGRIFIGDNAALIAHQRGDLGGFGTRRGGDIQHPARGFTPGKQGAHRQHGTGFLNVEQAA
ncbi:hypothetical protein D3C75_949920 [compost metagenome]